MKKSLTAVLAFAAVFCVSAIFQKYTLCNWESLGLFLCTPDYFRSIFSAPLPISNLLADFLTQSFKYDYMGALTMAVLITAELLMLRGIFRRIGFRTDILPVLGSCVAWFFAARAESLLCAAATVLITAAVCIVTLPLHLKGRWGEGKWDIAVAVCLLAAAGTAVVFNGKIRKNEDWAKIELYAFNGSWSRLLDTATPEAVKEDHEMMPWALLALNCKGELADKMFTYPVAGPQDLDTEGQITRRGYLFGSILYTCLGSPNEAIHDVFQGAGALKKGSSFRTLRQLADLNARLGNRALVLKYCEILSRSTFNKAFVAKYRALADKMEPSPRTERNGSGTAALIDHDQQTDLLLLTAEGISSPIAPERYLCYLLAKGDLETFVTAFSKVSKLYEDRIPRHFAEALSISNADYDNLYFSYLRSIARTEPE